ncbi:MAG: hypothetical protein J1E64_07475 [Acetatifactor sp.]|nr:hypothetical protein [Acetatifactor sp.]
MTDQTFGELTQEDDYGWWGKQTLDFGGSICSVDILIHGDEDEITQRQRVAFEDFIKKWPTLQENLIEALIKYYNEDEFYSYGPEDEEEAKEWWPEIKTKEALLQAVTLETIVVAWDFAQQNKRSIYILFSRTWGGEDLDDNGIGVHYVNEEIDEIGYKDMAF